MISNEKGDCFRIVLKLDRNRELPRAVDKMMARAKSIYILMTKINKLFAFFVAEFVKTEKLKICSICFYRFIKTISFCYFRLLRARSHFEGAFSSLDHTWANK